MKKFNHVIVRRPCKAMVEGITSGLYPGKPDYALALKEHDSYIEALKQCDVDVTVLEADERYRTPALSRTRRSSRVNVPSSPTPAQPPATAKRMRSLVRSASFLMTITSSTSKLPVHWRAAM